MPPLKPRAKHVLTMFVVLACLVVNAQAYQLAAWFMAAVYTSVVLFVRAEEIGIPEVIGSLTLPLVLIVLSGLHGFMNNAFGDFAKDGWYFLAPILYICFGYFVGERLQSVKSLVYVVTAAGSIVSMESLWSMYRNSNLLLSATTAEGYRHVVGSGALQEMMPVVLILMCRKCGIGLGLIDRYRWMRYMILASGSLVSVLALSRTLLIVLVLGLAVTFGRKIILPVVLLIIFTQVIPASFLSKGPAATHSFQEKFSHGGDEVTLHSYSNMAEINDNWRGFEGYRALQTYQSFSVIDQIFGGGFGTLVDIGFSMNLGGAKELEELPVLHNGFLYLLVKTGIFGFVCFGVFIVELLRVGRRLLRSSFNEERFAGMLFVWSALTIVVTQGVITGIYNKGALAPNLLLLGFAAVLYKGYLPSSSPITVQSSGPSASRMQVVG